MKLRSKAVIEQCNKEDNKILYFIMVIFFIRFFLIWLGYDRLPLLPGCPDEILFNDPAVSFSRGTGLALKSFKYDFIKSDQFFAMYPPVFPLIQSLIFKYFDISPFTLRFLNIFSHIVSLILLLCILYKLKNENIIDGFAFIAVTLLVLTEPETFRLARAGRLDMLVCLFGLISIVIPLYFYPNKECSKLYWILSSIFVGFSISTHPEGIFYLLTLVTMLNYKKLEWKFILLLIILPILIFLSFYTIHGKYYFEALSIMFKTGKEFLEGFSLSYFIELFSLTDLRLVSQKGGMATVLYFISLFAIIIRFLFSKGKSLHPRWTKWFFIMLILSIGSFILLQFFSVKVSSQRIIAVFPIAMLVLAVALSHLGSELKKKIFFFVSVILIINCLAIGIFFNKLKIEWGIRDPERFNSLVHQFPKNKFIGIDPQLWYSFVKAEYNIRVLYNPVANRTILVKSLLDKFDIIILESPNILLDEEMMKRVCKRYIIDGKEFVVIYN